MRQVHPASRATSERPAPSQRQVEQTQREEGEAILALADAALVGKGAAVGLLASVAERLRQGAAWDVRAVHADGRRVAVHPAIGAGLCEGHSALGQPRAGLGREKAGGETGRGVDVPGRRDFPGRPDPHRGPSVRRISRGFSVPAGDYDVFVVMRERVDPAAQRTRPKASVLRQPLSVPDFGSSELTTSSVILADRLTVLAEAVPADQLAGAAVRDWAERNHAGGRSPVRAGRGADCRFSRL